METATLKLVVDAKPPVGCIDALAEALKQLEQALAAMNARGTLQVEMIVETSVKAA